MSKSCYNNYDTLLGTMKEYGKYTLKYKPPAGAGETKIKMEIPSCATLDEMIAFFGDFLTAAGYVVLGELVVKDDAKPEKPVVCERHWDNFWEDDGNSVVGNPWSVRYHEQPTYIGSGVRGGMGEDHLSFSPVSTPFSSNPIFS